MSCLECYIRFIITKQEGHRPQGQGDYKPDIAQGGMTVMTTNYTMHKSNHHGCSTLLVVPY